MYIEHIFNIKIGKEEIYVTGFKKITRAILFWKLKMEKNSNKKIKNRTAYKNKKIKKILKIFEISIDKR